MSSTSSTSDDLRTSKTTACMKCRQRRSYCSKDRPSCLRCREKGLLCTYMKVRKVNISESRLRTLQLKADAYDELMNFSQTQNRTDTSADSCENDSETEQTILESFTQLSMTGSGLNLKDPSSSDTFLRVLRKVLDLHDNDTRLDTDYNLLELHSITPQRYGCRTNIRLPPIDMSRRLFAAQHTYIGTIFAFTNPTDAFEQPLVEAYGGSPNPEDKEPSLRYAKVLVILAFGQLYSVNQWVDFRGPPGFDYFVSGLNFMPAPHEHISILFVETLALVGYFFQNINCPSASSIYIGMALRMAISLGLHQEVSEAADVFTPATIALDEPSREHRRRVWWSIYSLERILATASGIPTSTKDEGISVQFPSRLPVEVDNWPAAVLRHHTELSRILGEIHAAIYQKTVATTRKPGQGLMKSVQRILSMLSEWNRDLPDELRFDAGQLSMSRESISIFSHYYQCINMTVRPLLSHIVQKHLDKIHIGDYAEVKEHDDWRAGQSATTVEVIEVCKSAAKDMISMMTIASEKNLVATYGYMDGEHILSATIVLVMVYIAFPYTSDNTAAMHAGLKLLRNMGERGNGHIASRYDMLNSVVQDKRVGKVPDAADVAQQTNNDLSADAVDFHTTSIQGNPVSADVNALIGSSQRSHPDEEQPPISQHSMVGLDEIGTIPDFLTLGNDFSQPVLDQCMAEVDFSSWEDGFTDPSTDSNLGFFA